MKNILVKADLTCCISDLGLALAGDKDGRIDFDEFLRGIRVRVCCS